MRHEVNDVRILKLAELYEVAYERSVADIAAQFAEDAMILEGLSRLVSPEARHPERIVEALERLNARLGSRDRSDLLRAALLDVRDVERSALEFYTRQADRVHDADVAALFRALAHDESEHVRIAEGLIKLADRQAGRLAIPPAKLEPSRAAAGGDALWRRPQAWAEREGQEGGSG